MTFSAISVTVTTGKRSVGMLSLSGNTRYPAASARRFQSSGATMPMTLPSSTTTTSPSWTLSSDAPIVGGARVLAGGEQRHRRRCVAERELGRLHGPAHRAREHLVDGHAER